MKTLNPGFDDRDQLVLQDSKQSRNIKAQMDQYNLKQASDEMFGSLEVRSPLI